MTTLVAPVATFLMLLAVTWRSRDTGVRANAFARVRARRATRLVGRECSGP
ncbi:MAG: hypothetical protein ABI836_14270 [Gemmatimonadota bacterium]